MRSKLNFFAIFLTSFITAGLLIGYYFIFLKDGTKENVRTTKFNFVNPKPSADKSERIAYNIVNKYVQSLSPRSLITVTYGDATNTGHVDAKPLKGFIFESRYLDTIINHNLSKWGQKPKKVIFYLGETGEVYDPNGDFKHAQVQVFAVGFSGDTLFTDNKVNNKTAGSIYDHADPCPPFCPKEQ